VRGLVSSEVTLGVAFHGRARNEDAHDPIVTREEWEAAQAVDGSRTPRGTYLLSGIVRCAACGMTMRGTRTGRGAGRVYKHDRGGETSSGRCRERPTIMCNRLDAFVTEQFLAGLDAFEVQAVESGSSAAEARQELDRVEALARLGLQQPASP
jgi:Recombinase zinc beta ribbon domain